MQPSWKHLQIDRKGRGSQGPGSKGNPWAFNGASLDLPIPGVSNLGDAGGFTTVIPWVGLSDWGGGGRGGHELKRLGGSPWHLQ
jgi:hypothetical protein